MVRTFRFRVYPSAAQERCLDGMFGALCELYNAALEERIDCYRKTGRNIGFFAQGLELKEVRSIDERFAAIAYTTELKLLQRLDRAFQAFFSRVKQGEKPGFPRFKARRRFDSVEFSYGDGFGIKQDRLRILGIDGLLKVRWHRRIPADAALGHAILSRKGNQWHISLTAELPDVVTERGDFTPVGIDVGISSLAALSTGELVRNPKWERASAAKLRRLNRSLARKKPHSRGWKAAKRALGNHHARLAAKRRDYLHKLSTRVVRDHSHIAVESLNIKGLVRGILGKSVKNAGWATFFEMLRYKAESAGSKVEAVDARYTSQTCPACDGSVVKTLSVRQHSCPHCGYEADRDVAAAQVILLRASFMGPGTGLDARSTPGKARLASEVVCESGLSLTSTKEAHENE